MSDTVTVLGMSGSLRKGSTNTAALRACADLLPEGMTLEIIGLGNLPLYDDDVRLKAYPPEVQHFRDRIKAADAILFATPEYNYSISGVLKNAIDWASRPPDQPFNWKPCAIISASGSLLGGVRGQYHLRHICVSLNCFPINAPQVYITEAPKKINAEGHLTDQATRDVIRQLLSELKTFALRLRQNAG
ncbi:MAG TPA: NAD(P)H-dependent oxidoreductase [Stellaceae bacterium]|nr:NAD(P)H-dependent oxidoreductase [Stellaceae bacterium]